MKKITMLVAALAVVFGAMAQDGDPDAIKVVGHYDADASATFNFNRADKKFYEEVSYPGTGTSLAMYGAKQLFTIAIELQSDNPLLQWVEDAPAGEVRQVIYNPWFTNIVHSDDHNFVDREDAVMRRVDGTNIFFIDVYPWDLFKTVQSGAEPWHTICEYSTTATEDNAETKNYQHLGSKIVEKGYLRIFGDIFGCAYTEAGDVIEGKEYQQVVNVGDFAAMIQCFGGAEDAPSGYGKPIGNYLLSNIQKVIVEKGEPVAVEYYTLLGAKTSNPKGLVIKKSIFADGSFYTEKEMK